MSTKTTSILYIEDHLADFKLLTTRLNKSSYSERFLIVHVQSLSEADNKLLETDFSLILLDLSLPDAHGLDGLTFLLKNYPEIPIVVLTGNTDDTLPLEAIKNGAQDFLVKQDLRADIFVKTCEYAIERKKINVKLKEAIQREEDLNDELRDKNVELHQAIEALKKEKKKGEEKKQQINSFVSMLVNDLKNPIRAISSLIGLINEEELSETQRKFIQQIRHSSDSMLENILRIIDTQYAADGVVKVNLQSENPYFTINSAIDKYVVEAIKKNIIIEITYKNQLPEVLIDKSTLSSAISGVFEAIFKLTNKATRLIIGTKIKGDFLQLNFLDRQLILSEREIQTLMVFEDISENIDEPININLGFVKQLLNMMGGNLFISKNNSSKGTVFSLSLKTTKLAESK